MKERLEKVYSRLDDADSDGMLRLWAGLVDHSFLSREVCHAIRIEDDQDRLFCLLIPEDKISVLAGLWDFSSKELELVAKIVDGSRDVSWIIQESVSLDWYLGTVLVDALFRLDMLESTEFTDEMYANQILLTNQPTIPLLFSYLSILAAIVC